MYQKCTTSYFYLNVLLVEMAPKTKGGKGKRSKKDLQTESEKSGKC